MPIGINDEQDLFIIFGKGDVGVAVFEEETYKGICFRELTKEYPIGTDLRTQEAEHEFNDDRTKIHIVIEKIEDLAALKRAIAAIENLFKTDTNLITTITTKDLI